MPKALGEFTNQTTRENYTVVKDGADYRTKCGIELINSASDDESAFHTLDGDMLVRVKANDP